MATLEDRLLGEKKHYYCSSSEDEEVEEDWNNKSVKNPSAILGVPETNDWEGSSTNTGPKGVIKDWQRFRQLEAEQRREQEREKIILAKKLAMSCQSHLDDEKTKEEDANSEENIDAQIDEQILHQYIMKRMEEMMKSTYQKKIFGHLITIRSGEEFLETIDKEEKEVTVVVHLYEPSIPSCETMNGCLLFLASDYPYMKFCCLLASNAGLSRHFQGTGLPALLIYKSGQMVGNFVRLTDDLGEDFFATDVESFLIEHGILLDKSLVPAGLKAVKGSATQHESDDED